MCNKIGVICKTCQKNRDNSCAPWMDDRRGGPELQRGALDVTVSDLVDLVVLVAACLRGGAGRRAKEHVVRDVRRRRRRPALHSGC